MNIISQNSLTGTFPSVILGCYCLQAKTKGIHSNVDIGVKYAERQERAFDEEKMKAGQCVIGLQVGLNFEVSVIILNHLNMIYSQSVMRN